MVTVGLLRVKAAICCTYKHKYIGLRVTFLKAIHTHSKWDIFLLLFPVSLGKQIVAQHNDINKEGTYFF